MADLCCSSGAFTSPISMRINAFFIIIIIKLCACLHAEDNIHVKCLEYFCDKVKNVFYVLGRDVC